MRRISITPDFRIVVVPLGRPAPGWDRPIWSTKAGGSVLIPDYCPFFKVSAPIPIAFYQIIACGTMGPLVAGGAFSVIFGPSVPALPGRRPFDGRGTLRTGGGPMPAPSRRREGGGDARPGGKRV